MRRILVYLIVCLFPLIVKAQSHSIEYSFKLPSKSTTSAGVFTEDGELIRTLWNNVELPQGTHNRKWDGLDDEGNLASNAKYKITVQTNNVKYEWEGVIGNTSRVVTGSGKHKAYKPIYDMAISGNKAYYVTGYQENASSANRFNLDDIQYQYNVVRASHVNQSAFFVATDGVMTYYFGEDGYNTSNSFVYATRVSDDSEVKDFKYGISIKTNVGRTYVSAGDQVIQASVTSAVKYPSRFSGGAVTRKKNFLYSARQFMGEQGLIYITDKRTMQPLGTISSFVRPRLLCVDEEDNLWVVSGENTVEKYAVNNDGTLSKKPLLSIIGLVDPLALGVSKDNGLIAICDGGNSQQVKAFSNTTGVLQWVKGERGGYTNSPVVTNDKFYFDDKVFVAFQDNGSFWVGDGGNFRVQHYSSKRAFIERIMYLPASYNVRVDQNNPSKVFNNYLEFKIDYTKPLAESWEVVRNYRVGRPAMYNDGFTIFSSVLTMSNGRTYAFIRGESGDKHLHLVELPIDAPMRLTGITFASNTANGNISIQSDGSLIKHPRTSVGGSDRAYRRKLIGFDNQNNPIWGAEELIYKLPTTQEADPLDFGSAVTAGQKTKNGLIITFKKGADRGGYHLGGIKPDENRFLWKASKSTPRSYTGDFPTDGTFDEGNRVNQAGAGGNLYVLENSIFWNYQGEFWKQSQTNYWNHFSDNGLMVGQFGTWRYKGIEDSPYGMAGNVKTAGVVKVGGDMYIYHCDEGFHAGVHRWKVSGLNSIKEISIPIETKQTGRGLLGQYYDGVDLDNVNTKTTRIDSTVNFQWSNKKPLNTDLTSSTNFSVSWTGYVTPSFTEKYTFYAAGNNGVRLWVNGELLVEQWARQAGYKEYSGDIELVANKPYAIRLEYFKLDGDASAALLWSSGTQKKEVIPASRLTPSPLPDLSKGFDLMEKLSPRSVMQNNLYGWKRSPVNEANGSDDGDWSITTNKKLFDKLDVHVRYYQPRGSVYTVTRNLGDANEAISNWKLEGNLTYEENRANRKGAGSFFEVLDDNGKIITRFFPEINEPLFTLYANKNTIIRQGEHSTVYNEINRWNKVEVVGSKNGITIKYGTYAPVTVPVFDSESNWKKPKTLRLHYTTGSRSEFRSITLEGFRFKRDGEAAKETKKNQSITFPEVGNRSFGMAPFKLTAEASSKLPVTYVVKAGPATISGDLVNITGVGKVIIQAEQSGDDKFLAADIVSQSFEVVKGSQTISFENISEKKMGDAPFTLTATASSKLPVSFKVKTGSATISGNTVTLTGAGTVVIEASQAGNENYTLAPLITQSFTVKPVETVEKVKIAQTISFADIKTKTATDVPFTINATASSGLPIAYVVKSGRATISGNIVTLTGGGSPVVIEASQAGDSKYNAAKAISKSFNVNKASQTILFNSLSSKKVTDAPFALNASASSELPVKYSIKSGPATITGNVVTLKSEGTVVIEATQSGNSKYKPAKAVSNSFLVMPAQITKTAQTITFGTISPKYLTDAPFILNATASSRLPVSFNVKSGPATISGNIVTLTGVGTAVIEASQVGNDVYNAAVVITRSIVVQAPKKADQTITFPNKIGLTNDHASFTLMATASSGLPVSYRVISGPITILRNVVIAHGWGDAVIEAYQPGNEKFNSAVAVTRTFAAEGNNSTTVVKLNQTITFSPIETRYKKEQFTLSANASSGLPVTYRVISGPAVIVGSKITLTDVGTVVVEASQAGSDRYNKAVSITQSIKVNNTSQKAGINNDNFVNNAIQNINDEAAAANQNFDFKIYPNPASTNTTVEFTLIESSEVNLELFSLNGMLIKRIQLGLSEAKTLNSYNLNTTDLPAGVYILRVLSRTDALSKRLLIVK